MARIEIPSRFLTRLGPEAKMDVHWVTVRLRDGRVIDNLVVRGGRYITGREDGLEGINQLDFEADDIVDLRNRCGGTGAASPLVAAVLLVSIAVVFFVLVWLLLR